MDRILLSKWGACLDYGYFNMFLCRVQKLSWSFAKHQFLILLFCCGILPNKFVVRVPSCFPGKVVPNLIYLEWYCFADYILRLEEYNKRQFDIFQLNLHSWTNGLEKAQHSAFVGLFNEFNQHAYQEASRHYQKRLSWILFQRKDTKIQHEYDSGISELKTFPFYSPNISPSSDPLIILCDKAIRKDFIVPTQETNQPGQCSTITKCESNIPSREDWVVNLSNRMLTEDEKCILKVGFKHAYSDSKVSSFDWYQQVEKVIQQIPSKMDSEVLRTKATNCIKAKFNLKRNENLVNARRILTNLKHDKTIQIINADKGNKTVVVNKSDYNRSMLDYLENKSLFEELNVDPTKNICKSLITLIEALCSKGLITNKFKNAANPPKRYNPPTIFSQIKLHKIDLPYRQILNSKNNPCNNLIKNLLTILNKFRTFFKLSAKNTEDVLERLKHVKVTKNLKLASIDVKDMFNTLPVEFVLQSVKYYAEKLDEVLEIDLNTLLELVKFCINSSYCKYENRYFRQIAGLSMGSALSPILAEITMANYERLYAKNDNLKLWVRYVDDILLIWSGTWRQLDTFCNKLNNSITGVSFVVEHGNENLINFLDLTLMLERDRIVTKIYRKHTYSGRYLNFNSDHHITIKKGIAINLFRKALQYTTKQEDKQIEIDYIYRILLNNDYPKKAIDSSLRIATKRTDNADSSQAKGKQMRLPLYFLNGVTHNLLNIFKMYNFKFVCKPMVTAADLYFKSVKRRITDFKEEEGCIYAIPCSCGEWYIGETKRKFKLRLNEHKNFNKPKYVNDPEIKQKSAIALHAFTQKHTIDWEKFKIIEIEKDDYIRKLKEAFFIQLFQPKMNVSPGVTIPPQWYYLFRREVTKQQLRLLMT